MNDRDPAGRPCWRSVMEKGYSDDCLWYTQYINQYLALGVTFLAWRWRIRPNAISAIGFSFTSAAVLLMIGCVPTGFAGSLGIYLLLSLGYVFDSSDGQLARVAGWGSDLGHFLDHFLDSVKLMIVNIAFGWIVVRHGIEAGGCVPAMACGVFAVNLLAQSVFFTTFNFKAFIYGPKLVATHLPNAGGSRRHLLILQPTDFGLFILLALLCHVPRVLLAAYAAFGIYHALVTLVYVAVSLRTMHRIEGA